MKLKAIFINLSLICSLALQGCYTQLSWFYPSPEEEDSFYDTYSRAQVRPDLGIYAQDRNSSTSLSYSMMHRRFDPMYSSYYGYSNYYNPYNFYNPYSYLYGNGGYSGLGYYNYGYGYRLGGYTMIIPGIEEKDIRNFTKDRKRPTDTNLRLVRTSNTNSDSNTSSNRNSGSSSGRSSSVSSTRSSGGSSSSGKSSRSSGSSGRRATRRN